MSGQQLNASNRQLLDALHRIDPNARLEIANALWLRKGLAVNPEFVAVNKDSYHAEVSSLDFADDPRRAAGTINAWVDRDTQGKIPSIVDELERDTALVLTDAVYFKGMWSDPFDPANTKPRTFFLPSGKTITTPMMEQDGVYGYLETNIFRRFVCPMAIRGSRCMYFLSRKKDGLAGCEVSRSDALDGMDESPLRRPRGRLNRRPLEFRGLPRAQRHQATSGLHLPPPGT